MKKIYLDNSATTKPYDVVVEETAGVMAENYGNPSSAHGMGFDSEKIIRDAREKVSVLIGVSPEEIYFTSGGTEANNWVITQGISPGKKKRHIITTKTEHPSILQTCKRMESDQGIEITYLPVDSNGIIDLEKLKENIREETALVSIMHINNETGSIQPIEEIKNIVNPSGAFLHVDHVQGAGKVPISISGIDMLTLSAHKIHGPKGVGALYINDKVNIKPLLVGGEQEKGLRAGTENLSGIAGFGAAAECASKEISSSYKKLTALKDLLVRNITDFRGVHFNSPTAGGAPHILNIFFEGVEKSELLIRVLETHGVYVSSGSACHSRRPELSHVLKAMGLKDEVIQGSIRISFSVLNTEEEIGEAWELIKKAVAEVRQL